LRENAGKAGMAGERRWSSSGEFERSGGGVVIPVFFI